MSDADLWEEPIVGKEEYCESCQMFLSLPATRHRAACGAWCIFAYNVGHPSFFKDSDYDACHVGFDHYETKTCPNGCFRKELQQKVEPVMEVVKIFMVRPWASNETLYFDNEDDAQLAATGTGEYGENCIVIPVDALKVGSVYRELGHTIIVRNSTSPKVREEALRKLSPFERKVLGVKVEFPE